MIRFLTAFAAILSVGFAASCTEAVAAERSLYLYPTEVSALGANCPTPDSFLISYKASRSHVTIKGKRARLARGKSARFVTRKIDNGVGRQFITKLKGKRSLELTEVAVDLATGASCKYTFKS